MSDPIPLFGAPCGPWHWKFAWLPIRTYDARFVWLRWVARRTIQKHHYLPGGADFWFQYSLDHAPGGGGVRV
jgi:hypothetical protein